MVGLHGSRLHRKKAEVLLPKSSFVDANRKAYSQAGFIGKVMRNGLLTLVLAMPGLCVHRKWDIFIFKLINLSPFFASSGHLFLWKD